LLLAGELERAARRAAQTVLGHCPPELHARGMNDVARRQLARTGERGLAQLDWAVAVTLFLDARTTPLPDRARAARAEQQAGVGGIHDGVGGGSADVALFDHDSAHGLSGALIFPLSRGPSKLWPGGLGSCRTWVIIGSMRRFAHFSVPLAVSMLWLGAACSL